MNRIRISIVAILLITVPLLNLAAQEEGELLRFDNRTNLNFLVTDSMMRTISDSVIFHSPASAETHLPFNKILFNGIFSDSKLILQVRFRNTDTRWSKWQNGIVKIFPNGRFWARFDLPAGFTNKIEYRFLNKGIQPPARIQIFAIEAINQKLIDQINESLNHEPERLRFTPVDTIPKPPIITRQQWGAAPHIGPYIPHNPYRFAQHHTAGIRVSTLQQGIAEMQFIQNFHQNGRGWPDIGYHYCIDDSGRIYEGVPPQYLGTHTGGNNTGNVGISYMGNFHLPGEYPTQAALDSLVRIWSWLAFEFGVNPDSLFGHRDYKATACPGDNLYPEIPYLRNNIRRALGFGAPYAINPIPQPFRMEIPRNTHIQFSIRDEEEGVDINSIVVSINGDTILPAINGTPVQYDILYQPPTLFPYSQWVIVNVSAADFASPPNVMQYSYKFRIEVEALAVEVQTQNAIRNGTMQMSGSWQLDPDDVVLPGLTNGARLMAVDTDGSHIARVYPAVSEEGDYSIMMASSSKFLGESARYRFVNSAGAVHPHFAEYNRIFYNQWHRLSPTPVHFTTDSLTNGYIELSGLSDIESRQILDAFRLEKIDRLDPPTIPTLKWVRIINPAINEIEVAWYPSLEGDIGGYRLFMSDDGLTWNTPLVDETVLSGNTFSYTLTYSGSDPTVYFRVEAVDTNTFVDEYGNEEPLLSPPSDAYGARLGSSQKILIVDNFDRMASWTHPQHPFVANHGEALAANGQGFESCTETAVQNGEIDLTAYDMVIYFCGDDSRSDESLAAADQLRLLNYLESGGKLFISGSEIGYDFDDTTPTEQARYQYLLRARYVGDLSGSNRVLGQPGTLFDGLDFIYGTMTGPDLYIEDFPDYLNTYSGSEVALIYDNLRIAGIKFTGTYGNSSETAQLVYLGFTFETITTQQNRAALMGRVLDYFGLATAIADNETVLPEQFRLAQNFPNPFNPSTKIQYTIPADKSRVQVKLEIFNTLGQKLITLVDEKQAAGSYEVEWDGRGTNGFPAASGIYYYRLTVADLAAVRKMLLVR